MTEKEKIEYIEKIDNELFLGGVMLSEWCCFIVNETDTAYIKGAYLGTIITALSAI